MSWIPGQGLAGRGMARRGPARRGEARGEEGQCATRLVLFIFSVSNPFPRVAFDTGARGALRFNLQGTATTRQVSLRTNNLRDA
jgi:hypothetical protein